MALQVINDPYRNLMGGLGASAGAGLSKGLQSHLDELAQEKLLDLKNRQAEYTQARRAQKLAPFLKSLGLPEGSEHLPESNLSALLRNVGKSGEIPLTSEQISTFGIPINKANEIKSLPPQYQKFAIQKELESAQGNEFLKQLGLAGEIPTQAEKAPQTTKSTIGGGLNPKLATEVFKASQNTKSEALKQKRHEENIKIKKQEAIEKRNTPIKKTIRSEAAVAKDVDKIVQEALDLFNTGEVQAGTIKGFIPDRFQNSTTQAFVSKINELVTKKAQLGKGVPSRMRLLLEQASKPNTWQKPNAIKYLLNSIKENVQEAQEKESIMDQIIRESEFEPKNLDELINNRYTISQLPPAQEYTDDTIIKINGIKFKKNGNDWKEIS